MSNGSMARTVVASTAPQGKTCHDDGGAPERTVSDSVDVPRVGALRYESGLPIPDTSWKLFDEMDFQRAMQALLPDVELT
jgi:hypothetical protein